MPAAYATIVLPPSSFEEVKAPEDGIAGLADRTTCLLSVMIEVRVCLGPGPKLEVHLFQQENVLGIVPLHGPPGFAIAPHTSKPEMFSGMWQLPTTVQIASKVVELIRVESKMLLCNLESIYSLVGGWRRETVGDKPGV